MAREQVLSRRRQLLERNRELAEVDACVADASAEQGSFVVLEGRAGMGKSAFLAEVRRRAAAAGMTTCVAVGSELECDFAFGIVRQLFEPTIGSLTKQERARVLEGAAGLAERLLDSGGDQATLDPFAALHGLYWLAANLAARAPLLLAVDDAHWSDVASLRWLAYLLNRLEGLPILVTIATRPASPGPGGEVLTTIAAHADARILAIGPLGEESVAALVRAALGAEPDPIFTAACVRATAGNALGLNELLRDLQARGVEPTRGSAVDLDQRAPDAIARRVQRDLKLLGEEAERLASAIAVIGDGTELRLTARLADLHAENAAKAADDLFGADILASERPPRFAHPLLRAAVYDHLPEGPRQKMHGRAAEILHAEGADPEVVAAHLLRCDAARSLEAIEWLRGAAPVALRRGAPAAAVSYLRRALAEGPDAAHRTTVLAELGRAEMADGDPAAIGHLREALAGTTNRRTRVATLVDLGMAVVAGNDERGGRDLFDQALEESRGSDQDAAIRLECLVRGASGGDPRVTPSADRRVAPPHDIHYPRLRELARGGTPSAGFARVTLAYLLSWHDGDREETRRWVGPDFGRSGLLDGDWASALWSICALTGIDELHRVVGWCETVIRAANAQGHFALSTSSAMHGKAFAEARMGLLAEAEADAAASLEFSQQHVPFGVPEAGAHLAEILFVRGKWQEAYQVIESVSAGAGIGVTGVEAVVREIRGRLRLARGWREQGVGDLRASGRLCEFYGLRNPIINPWRASLATALGQGGIEEARELAREDLANARRSGIPRAVGIALRTLGGLNHDDSIELLRAAVAALEESPGQLDLARALTDLGAALRHQGYRVEAREPLRESLEIAARCGAVPLMERAEAEAAAAGARPRRPRLRGVDALTPSELRVARLAAEGGSNREIAQALFVTAKTVADHLTSSYSKLGITSRDELGGALQRSNP